ncbi:MAG: tocopherol cyclase family protein [Polyangiales bacterium]
MSAAPDSLDAESWNLTRFDARTLDPRKGHLESTFLKLNDPGSGRALWVKLTIFAPTSRASGGDPREPGRTIGEAWAIAFDPKGHVAVKAVVPIEEATLSPRRPYRLGIAGVSYDGRRVVGEITHGTSKLRFDVELEPVDGAPLVHFPSAFLYRAPLPKSKLVSPIVDARARGFVEIVRSGVSDRWTVERWPAMQGHNWGTAHADLYAWGHCNAWNEPEGEGVVLEGFSAKVKLGGVVTSPLITLVALRHHGARFEIAHVRELGRASGSIEELRVWRFACEQAGARIEGTFELRTEDTVGLYYPNPSGEMTYCLNSKIARAELVFQALQRPAIKLTSNAAALEIATHDADHGVKMYV